MPLGLKLGGHSKKIEINKNATIGKNCLTLRQAEYIYKKVELGSLINKNTMKEEIDPSVELNRMDNNSGDENPYRELRVNNTGKIESTLSQMEEWLILSNVINYIQYSKNPRNFQAMSIKPTNKNKINVGRKEGEKDRFTLQVSLTDMTDRLTEEYLDRYEGVRSDILNMTRFDENSDLSMTYLGRSSMVGDHKIVAEERFPMSEQGKLLDSTEYQILLDTEASKSFMSKSHYLCCKSLHSLPKFMSKTHIIQLGNRQHVSILFVITIIIDIHGQRFKYTKNIDIVLGIKNVFELDLPNDLFA